jgi:hypothetical protein
VGRITVDTPDPQAEVRLLVHRAQFDPDPEEREKARRKMREIAADWRGFPGQRRRGELPADVEIR